MSNRSKLCSALGDLDSTIGSKGSGSGFCNLAVLACHTWTTATATAASAMTRASMPMTISSVEGPDESELALVRSPSCDVSFMAGGDRGKNIVENLEQEFCEASTARSLQLLK